jgi:hypothetical protein
MNCGFDARDLSAEGLSPNVILNFSPKIGLTEVERVTERDPRNPPPPTDSILGTARQR